MKRSKLILRIFIYGLLIILGIYMAIIPSLRPYIEPELHYFWKWWSGEYTFYYDNPNVSLLPILGFIVSGIGVVGLVLTIFYYRNSKK